MAPHIAMLAMNEMPVATAAATEPIRMSRLRTCMISWARTPLISSQLQMAMRPSVTATAACSGLRPVAKAFGCGSGLMYSFGIGMSARWQRSVMIRWYSGYRAGSAGTAWAARMASLSDFQ